MKVFETKIDNSDIKLINEVLISGELGFGPLIYEFEYEFKKFSNKEYNVSVNSASAAAFMIFAYLKEKYGICEIYTPSLGFASPVWAAQHFGHEIIWVDVDDNLLFDCEDYLKKSELPGWKNPSGKKKVVMPILYGGVSNIPNWKLRGNEIVIIDSAHCVTPTIKADMYFFSFHPYKPICTSDGGMISTDDQEASEWFKNYRNFGRKTIGSTYDITMDGFKFYMNNLNACIGLTQMKKYKENLILRKNNYNTIKSLCTFDDRVLDHDINSSYYFATLITDKADSIIEKFGLARHYPLLHKTSLFKTGFILKNTERLHKNIVNLPLYKIIDL